MAETLYASASSSGTCLTPTNAVGTTSGTWTTNVDNSSWTHIWDLDNPVGTLAGTDVVEVLIRARHDSGNNPTIDSVRILESGTERGVNSTGWTVSSLTGEDVTLTVSVSGMTNWDNAQIEIATTAQGGSPGNRSAVQVDYMHATVQNATTDRKARVAFAEMEVPNVPPIDAVRGISTAVEAVGATDLTINKPSGTVEGDIMYALIIHETGTSVTETPPSGWADVGTVPLGLGSGQSTALIYKKTAGASEPASYTFSTNTSNQMAGTIVAIKNTYTEDVFSVSQNTTVPSSHSLNSISTSATALIALVGTESGGAGPTPYFGSSTGMTSRADTYSVYTGAVVAVFDETISSITSTTETFTSSESGFDVVALLVSFVPASTDRKARVAFAELEVPNAPRKARVSFAELEVPTAPRKARVAFAEMEVPDAPPSITLIGTVQAGGNSNGGDVTLTFDGSPAQNDMVLLFTGHGTTGTENPYSPSTAGYTEVPSSHIYDTTGAKTSFAVFYKFMGATPDTSVTVQGNGVAQDATAAVSYMLRGVDQATPLDTAIQMGAEFAASTTPDPPSITTVTANAWVFAAIQWSNATTINTYPSGYTNTTLADGVDTNRIRLGVASKEVASPGAEDPGVYTLSGTAEGYPFTLAIRPGSPTADRKARVSFGELEVPDAPRKARVSFAELEVPTAPRRARVAFAEMEIPTAPRRARVAFAEMEVPNAPRKARVAFAALETPDAPRRVRVSFAELETGDGARRVRVSFAEMEIPTAPRKGRVSYAAFETPNAPTNDRQAQVSFAEFEVPTAPRRGRVSFAEMEASDAPRRSRVSFAEFEVPEGQRKARVSFAELEVPTAPRRAQVAFAEFEIPTAPRKARVSFAELETPSFARRCVLVWCVLEAPNAPTTGKTRTRMMVKFTQ